LGGKLEAGKTDPGPVVAQEDLAAYEHLRTLAQSMGLDTRYEVIPSNGMLNLNREGLIVICGPRLSPLIAQVLASDTNLTFEKDDARWPLVGHVAGRVSRPAMDAGEPGEYAYVGRLPRLDGHGTCLYIAGSHAVGAAGVVHYLANHMEGLYRDVRRQRRWS